MLRFSTIDHVQGPGRSIVEPPIEDVGPPKTPAKNHLPLAVVATVFFVPPMGYVAWKAALRVDERLAAGDVEAARVESRKAARWAWASIAIGAVLYPILLVILYHQLKALGLGLRSVWPLP
jgi:hypothetical protein